MAALDETISLKSLGGTWEECGRDRLAGITPENITASANRWGSDRISFKLRRQPGGQPFPDLSAFTDIEYRVHGQLVWAGRVIETPTQDGPDATISVEGHGWQYHLDDDVTEHGLVRTRLSDFQDMRSAPNATLSATALAAAGTVSSDDGGIVLGFPKGYAINNPALVGVVLDMGPESLAKRVIVNWSAWGTDGAYQLYVRGSDYPDNNASFGWAAGNYDDAIAAVGAVPGPTTSRGTFATARRYVQVFFYSTFAQTLTLDIWLRINSIQVFTDTAYESGDASIVKAPTIINDALDRATMLLSTDRSQIDPNAQATFTFPDVAPTEPRTAREMWQLANTPHDWVSMIDVNRRPVFKPRPTVPLFEVGNWSGAVFKDASANSGEDIYSRTIVQATGPDGNPIRTERTQGQQTGAAFSAVAAPAATNPSFEVDTSGWTPSGSVVTRDTVVFDTGVASLRWDNTGASDNLGAGDTLTGTFVGTFLAGVTYKLTFRIRPSNSGAVLAARLGDAATGDLSAATNPAFGIAGGSWGTATILWTPTRTTSNVTLTLTEINLGAEFYRLDTFALFATVPTLVDRHSFRRTKVVNVAAALTDAPGQTVGDIFLAGHKTAKLKGDLDVAGIGAVRRVLGGAGVHPAFLLRETNQLVTLNNRIDPDTGRLGRDGEIAAVTYDADTMRAQVAIDNERDRLEPVLARYSIISGQA